ncbi:FeoC-like transcriptional regulator [Aliiroseovarius sp. CAU 1755]
MAVLLDIRNYVKTHGHASLLDLSHRFHLQPEAIRGMLDHWQRKGVIRRVEVADNCGGCAIKVGCGSCSSNAAFETYEWAAGRA